MGQTRAPHRLRGGLVIVAQPLDPRHARLQHGKARLGAAIIGGHPDHPGIDPVDMADTAHERQAAMPGQHHVDRSMHRFDLGDFLREIGLGRSRPQKPRHIRDPAMDHRAAPPVMREDHQIRQAGHPVARVSVKAGTGMGKPARRQKVTGAARRKAATAIHLARRQLDFAIPRHHCAARLADRGDRARGIGAIGHDIARADDPLARDALGDGPLQQRLGGLQVRIGTAKDQHRPVQLPQIAFIHRHSSLDCRATRPHNPNE
ncbi:hypothetical protein RAZWK3B_17628 [Roseobacter sp. AzwK-3b]|nr:hypothetical protein RAZWK3B_17628 [Roseobacter sp. AzwK-3b]